MEAIEQLSKKIDDLLELKSLLEQENQSLKKELEEERQKNMLVSEKVNALLTKIDAEISS
ncbi:MAG: hypothetical protein D5R98_08830 [Desulfonatronovibrio sp. MSAO_Bac4]|nr:MAG: hypothetical protein D5R98_08830 [Desulfonatronovibrio sp. MSAO_Bac4]